MAIDEVIGSETSDYRDLLNSDSLFLNGRLAKIYGADLPPDAPFTTHRGPSRTIGGQRGCHDPDKPRGGETV